jgi:hypothetical protein
MLKSQNPTSTDSFEVIKNLLVRNSKIGGRLHIDYQELKRGLNLNLRNQLEVNTREFDQKPDISDLPSLQTKYPDYTHEDICLYYYSLKNINAKRLVPICNELINLRFLEFYNN